MNIRKQENALFQSWKRKYWNFVIDGAPSETAFANAKVRTVIVLKDVNAPDIEGDFDLRHQLATNPHHWWDTVATWCQGMTNATEGDWTWSDLYVSGCSKTRRSRLQNVAFVQLKKTCGGGSIKDAALKKWANSNAVEIAAQIQIYQPHIIVAAGAAIGGILAGILPKGLESSTKRGIKYTRHALGLRHPTYLIHYVHPSTHAPKSIICFGLLDAYSEIIRNTDISGRKQPVR